MPVACRADLWEVDLLCLPDEDWAAFAAEHMLPSMSDLRPGPVRVKEDGTLEIRDAKLKRFADQVEQEVTERRRRELAERAR